MGARSVLVMNGIDDDTTILRLDAGCADVIPATPTVTADGYSANDVLGGVMEVVGAGRSPNNSGVLLGISMTAEDDADAWVASSVDVLLFKAVPSGTYGDNDPLAMPDADADKLLWAVTLDEKTDCGNVTLLAANNINLAYICDVTSLYAVAVNRGGISSEAADALTFKFHILRD